MNKISEQMRSHGKCMVANAAKLEERSERYEETKRKLRVLQKDNKALRKCIEVVCHGSPGVCPRKDSPLQLLDAVHNALWKKKRQAENMSRMQETLLEQTETELDEERTKREAAEDGLLCVVCCENSRSKVLLPCKHLVLCDTCPSSDECPICRMRVKKSLQVFLS